MRPASLQDFRIRSQRSRAFTLIEVLVALGLIGITAGASLSAMLRINDFAFVGRLYTGAITVTQNQIDLILSDSPFNPQRTPAQIPPELVTDLQNGGPQIQYNVPIYKDPVTNIVSVTGTMATSIVDTGATVGGNALTVYRATVTVSYRFRERNYSVVMSTMRASDL